MNLSKKECTELQIKEAARRLFFVEGKINATTQEIGDAAGVNRTLINYYFRSRDELFRQVYQEARAEIVGRIESAFQAPLPIREKTAHIIDVFSDYILKEPYTELFMIAEINNFQHTIDIEKTPSKAKIDDFLTEIEQGIRDGVVRPMVPLNFIINLFALITHPLLLKPLYLELYNLNEETFSNLFQNRKEMILTLLFEQQ